MSICSGIKIEGKNWTFTKDYAVDYEPVGLNIPFVLLNFVGGQTGHSNCIMDLIVEWVNHKTFSNNPVSPSENLTEGT